MVSQKRSFFFQLFTTSRCSWVMVILASGCIEPFNPLVLQISYDYLVVEGTLINGMDPTVIKLSRTQTLSSKEPVTSETNAVVQIEEEQGGTTRLTNNNDGTYSAHFLNLNASKNYRIKISAGGKEYASDFVAVKKSPAIDSVTWQEDSDALQFYVDTHDPENKAVYYLWTYEETWQYSSKFYSIYKFEDGRVKTRDFSNELYYCWKFAHSPNIFLTNTRSLSQDVVAHQKLHRLLQVSRKLEYGYSLLLKQHALTKEAYEYWENLKRNNEKIGTLFDRAPQQDIGNIQCISHPEESVLGYFSATSLSKKRIFISRQDVLGPSLPSPKYEPSGYELCGDTLALLNQINDKGLNGLLLLDRRYDLATQELVGYLVAPADCVDCRFHGGTTTKPPYWK